MGVETSNAEPYIQGANGVGNNAKDLLLNPFGGDVGIGTTSPTTSLHIQGANTTGKGQLVVSSASAGQEARMTFIDGSDDIAEISTNGDHLYFYNERSSGAFQFYTGGNERARLDSNGRLLIGTTTEGEHTADDLTVATSGDTGISIRSGTSSSGRLFFSDGTSSADEYRGFVQYTHSNNTMLFGTDATERMRIDSSGFVGIGLTNPGSYDSGARNLVVGSTGNTGILIKAGTSSYSNLYFGDGTGAASYRGTVAYNHSEDSLRLGTAGNERMRITSGGLVYVGTTTAAGSAHVFATSAPGSFAFKVHNTNSNNSVATRGLQIKYDVSPNDTNNAIELNVGNGVPFVVRNNGNAQNTNGSFTAFSDARYKENIVDASSQWEDIKNTRIRNWNFRPELGWATHTMIGPVAQELELVSPGLVDDNPVVDEDGNDTGEVQKSVNQSVLYMKAVKALQEAMDRIETLEAKVAALEAQ